MKKLLLLAGFAFLNATDNFAQLYSSGNNVIAGSNVGIGIAAPLSRLHIFQNSNSTVNFFQMQNTGPTGAARLIFANDIAANSFSITKYGSGHLSGFPGITGSFPFANLMQYGNNAGGMLINNLGNIGISTFANGSATLRFFVDYSTGKVGLGGSAVPRSNVHINTALGADTLRITNATGGQTAVDGLIFATTGSTAAIVNMENSTLSFGTNSLSRMTILANGAVQIGTSNTPAGYKLYVETGILTEKVKVALKSSANWADYVFAEDYKLQPLHEVETYIKQHKHLPGIPSANEVIETGLDLGAMDAKLLEKIEELTLHMIRLEKEVNSLKSQNEELTKQVKSK